MVDAVVPHLDHREESPRAGREQVLGEPEAAVRHLVELLEQPRLVLGAKVLDVEDVLADVGLTLDDWDAMGKTPLPRQQNGTDG